MSIEDDERSTGDLWTENLEPHDYIGPGNSDNIGKVSDDEPEVQYESECTSIPIADDDFFDFADTPDDQIFGLSSEHPRLISSGSSHESYESDVLEILQTSMHEKLCSHRDSQGENHAITDHTARKEENVNRGNSWQSKDASGRLRRSARTRIILDSDDE